MQEVTIKVDWPNEKGKKKAIKMVSENKDVQSFSVDDENKELTMKGEMDPVKLVLKMRKQFPTEIIYMGDECPIQVEPPMRINPWPPHPPPTGYPPYPNSYLPMNGYSAYGHPPPPNPYSWPPPSAPPLGGYNGHYGYR